MKKISLIILIILTGLTAFSQSSAVTIRIGSESGTSGSEIIIPITADNFDQILSFQGTIEFDPLVATFVGTENYGVSDFSSSSFGTNQSNSGYLSFSWYDPSLIGQSISDGETLFSIRFRLIGANEETSSVQLSDAITNTEFVNSLYNVITVYNQTGQISITGDVVTGDEIILTIPKDTASQGSEILIPVKIEHFNEILSIQGSIHWDETILTWIDVESFNLPDMNIGNFGTSQSSSGVITYSWNDLNLDGETLTDNSALFYLKFEIIGNEGDLSPISFENSPTQIEFADTSYSSIDFTCIPGSIFVGDNVQQNNLLIHADSIEGGIGSIVQIPIRANNFQNVISMQGSLNFDQTIAEFDTIIQYGLDNFSFSNFGTNNASIGNLTFSWNDPSLVGVSVPNESAIFVLQFTLIGNIGDISPLLFENVPTNIEFIDNNFTEIQTLQSPGQLKIIDLYNLEITNLSDINVCAGESISLDYYAEGNFLPTNIFTAYLSDESGDFTSPTNIGQINSNTSGSIIVTIPEISEDGNNYNIRLKSNSPIYTSDNYIESITVHALPNANAGLDQNICTGNSTTLNASGGNIYNWNSGENTAEISVSPIIDTEYIVTVTDIYSCVNTDTVNIIVNPLPIAFAGDDENICLGDNINLTATGGTNYAWSNGDNTATTNVNPITNSEFIVTVTDDNLCSNSDTVLVNVFEVVADAGIDQEICIGESATFTATGGTLYSWSNGATTANINVTPTVNTEYYVTVTGVNSCTDIDTVAITVHALPNANAGLDQNICTGNSTSINASGGNIYNWNSGENTAEISVSPIIDTEYIVTVTDIYSCVNTDTINIIVNPLPTAFAGDDENICLGESITLTATGGTNYAWNNGDNTATTNVNPITNSEFIVTVTDDNLCSNSDTVLVNVFEVVADAGIDQEICIGESATFTATGGTLYSWSNGATTANINVTPTVNTEYYVTVTGINSCTDIDTVAITVHALPNANAGLDQNICTGNSTSINASGGNIYNWNSGENTTEISVSPIIDTEYIVTVTDIYSCVNTDTVNIIVNPLPTAFAGDDENICLGDNVNLTATGGTNYAWSNGDNTATTNVNPITNSEFIVTVTDDNLCSNTDTVLVNVFEVVADAGIDQEICIGESATFTATGGTLYSWSNGATTANINVTPTVNTEYYVTVTGINSCTDIDTVAITVHALPNANAGLDQNICTGNSTSINASGGNIYNWNSGENTAEISVSPIIDTEYIVTVTDIYSCVNTDTINIIVNPLPIAFAGDDENICLGDNVNLTATGGTNYAWNNGDNTATTNVNPITNSEFIVTVTDDNLCSNTDTVLVNVFEVVADAGIDQEICIGESATFTATGGTLYSWSNGATTGNINVTPTVNTEYYVTVTGVNSCTDIDTVAITVHALPNANAGLDQNICTGNSTSINASGGNIYNWNSGENTAEISVSPIIDTEYIVTVTDIYSCVNTDTINIIVNPLPNAFAGDDENICLGDNINLTATGGTNYAWNNGENTATTNVNPITNSEFIVTVTDDNLCSNSDTVLVNVFEVVADAGIDQEICIGESATFTATGGTLYSWSNGATTANINVTPTVNTEYYVTVTGINSCTDIDTVAITVHALPNANAGLDQNICTGNSTTLTASGGNIYNWNSGENTAEISVSPIIDTEYIVTVTDIYSCVNTDTINIIVNPLPNAFAGDDENICLGDNINLTATGGTNYAWNNGENTATTNVNPITNSEFIVTVTDDNLCSNSDTVLVNVFEVVADAGIDQEICIGESATFTATGGTLYSWSNGATTSEITVNPTVNTDYYVTVTGVNSCTDIDTVAITVNNIPNSPTIPTGPTELCSSNNTDIYYTHPTAFATSYIWELTNPSAGILTGNDTSTYLQWDPDFTGNVEIFVQALNECGSATSDSLEINIYQSPEIDLGNDTTFCFGDSIKLYGDFADTYLWSTNEEVSEIWIQNSGIFWLESSIGICTERDSITINISDPVVDFGQDTIHETLPYYLDAGDGFSEYLWSEESTTQTIEVTQTGWYSVVVLDNFNCEATDSVYIDDITYISTAQEFDFEIYPNPTTNLLYIKSNNIPATVVVTSTDGRTILRKEIINNNTTIQVSSFSTGLYLIEYNYDKKRICKKLFIY